MTKYVLNHLYRIKDDEKRAFIISTNHAEHWASWVEKDWVSAIHPKLGVALLQFQTPKTYDNAIESIASECGIKDCEAKKIVDMLIGNKTNYGIKYGNQIFRMPKNLIIDELDQKVAPYVYSDITFSHISEENVDLRTRRFIKSPLTLVFMVTNKCVTDCVYCYADKSKNIEYLPFDKVEDFIVEAQKLGIKSISLDGGEVFVYPYWRDLLKVLKTNGYDVDFISTKMPLKRSDIDFIKSMDITIQVSLDSIYETKLSTILQVDKSYSKRILNSILQLDDAGVKFQIATVLTKYNCNVEDLDGIYKFLSPLKNLKGWLIRTAFRSLYSKEDFNDIKATSDMVVSVENWINIHKALNEIPMNWSGVPDEKYFQSKNGSREFSGALCSANYSNLFILPDGNVTICEQLYWNPKFIIGNLAEQTIEHIWKSERALRLAYPKRFEFSEDSACRTCAIFDECIKFSNRCYADIIKAYGWDHTDYPDPRCCKAPGFKHELRMK